MESLPIEIRADVIYLEDLEDKVIWSDKLIAAAVTWLVPIALLEFWFGLGRIGPDDVVTVIFTSGTTGDPKGVMLTYRNVGSNIDALDQILGLRQNDVVLAILPFFHSFGYTGTLWTILTMKPKGVYHHNPLEPRPIGKLSRQHGATIMVATATFLRFYLRRCEPEDFATMEVVFVAQRSCQRNWPMPLKNDLGFGLMKATGRRNSRPSRAATSRPAGAPAPCGRAASPVR